MPLLKSLSAWPKVRRNTFSSVQFSELIWFIFTTVGARLSYPECKDISASSNATEAKYIYTGYLNPRSVQYFRLGPEHFYSSNDLYLRVSWNLPFTCWRWLRYSCSFLNNSLRPCTDWQGTACRQPRNFQVQVTPVRPPCRQEIRSSLNSLSHAGKWYPINAVIFTYQPLLPPSKTTCLVQVRLVRNALMFWHVLIIAVCTEKECHTPDQVKFIVSHSGMRCNSAVAGAILSNLTLALAALMTWFLNRWSW